VRRSEQLLARMTAEAEDVVCPPCGGCGVEPAVDPDATAAGEGWEELRSMARRYWTGLTLLEQAGLADILDAEIVDEDPQHPGGF
jgi:hypothetical protein